MPVSFLRSHISCGVVRNFGEANVEDGGEEDPESKLKDLAEGKAKGMSLNRLRDTITDIHKAKLLSCLPDHEKGDTKSGKKGNHTEAAAGKEEGEHRERFDDFLMHHCASISLPLILNSHQTPEELVCLHADET